jgi:hypothetical protein
MAANNKSSSTTGAEFQGDIRRRNVGNNQLNGSDAAKELADKVHDKSKKQVRTRS